jgi:hypothetical protein
MKFRMNDFRFPAPRAAAVTFALALSPCAIWAQLPVIDNFKTCTGKLGPFTSGQHTVVQKGTTTSPCSMVGGERQLNVNFNNPPINEFNQTMQAEVQASDKEGAPPAYIVSAGYKAYGGVQLIYGSGAKPLNLSLAGYDAIRVTFDGIEGSVNFNLVEFDNKGNNDCGINPGNILNSPLTIDFPFASFGSSANWSDVVALVFEFQAIANLGVPNFAITSIEAIVESAQPPATMVCPAS